MHGTADNPNEMLALAHYLDRLFQRKSGPVFDVAERGSRLSDLAKAHFRMRIDKLLKDPFGLWIQLTRPRMDEDPLPRNMSGSGFEVKDRSPGNSLARHLQVTARIKLRLEPESPLQALDEV